jgi:glutamate-1-semialdehyde aminotransferase
MSGEQAVAQALDAIRQAYEEAAAIIEQIRDPQEAFTRADELAEGIRKVYDEQAITLQRQQVERIWTSEEMSLTELAKRTNRASKQRAKQLLKSALDRRGVGDV